MKRLLNLGLSILLALGLFSIEGVKAETEVDDSEIIRNNESGIPDRLLYRKLLDKCDDNGDQLLSINELQSVTSLQSDDFGITNLKGIGYLTNLEHFEFVKENITDIKPLKNLKNLKYLKLEEGTLSDLSGIDNLTNLTELYLGDNNISNISALQNLRDLEILHLQENNITDISPLSNLTNLKQLWINNNKITNLNSLSRMINLTDLDAGFNKINDITGLRNTTSMINLSLNDNNIKDLSALKNQIKIEQLYLSRNNIEQIDALQGLKNLRGLYLGKNSISDLTPIKDLIYLKDLFVYDNKLTTLPDLTLLTDLRLYNSYWETGTLLYGNKLTEQELKNKMPRALANDEDWIYQNKYTVPDVTNVQITSIGSTGMKLQWDKCDDVKYYKVYRSTGYYDEKKVVGTVDAKYQTFTDKNLKPNQQYYYYIVAYDEVNSEVMHSENYSDNTYATTAPKATTDVKATAAGKNKVMLTWSESDGADGYIIYRKVGNGKFEYRYMVKGTSFTDTTASSTEYNYYRVYPYYESWKFDKRILADNGNYDYAKGVLKATTGLRATSSGKKKVTVTWNKVTDAEGYIIYRKVGNGKFEYRYIVKGTSFTDTTASSTEYNYYRIYPYYTENGVRILGESNDYKYAKGVLSAVTNLKATTAGKNKVKVTWNPTAGAEGYIIYRKVSNGKFEYRYMVKGTSFVDASASNTEYNYYRVYPYHTENGKRILGISDIYKYAKGSSK